MNLHSHTSSAEHAWLEHPDIAYRLYRGRELLRDIVRAVYQERCHVDWSLPQAPYEGVMVRTCPPQIRINPRHVMVYDGHDANLLIEALYGIALHEASHAIHTSRRWGETLDASHSRFKKQSGYGLPASLLLPIANWAEDVYIEDRLAETFPGFRACFRSARLYVLPDARCETILAEASRFRSARDASTLTAGERNERIASLVQLLAALVNRPGILEARLPGEFATLLEAAQRIAASGRRQRLVSRLNGAIEAADQVFQLVRDLLASNSSAVGAGRVSVRRSTSSQTSDWIEEALRERIPLLRDGCVPLEQIPMIVPLSAELQDEMARFEESAAEVLPAIALTEPPEPGTVILAGKSVVILDSNPHNLYNAAPYKLDRIAAAILAEHFDQAQELRRRLRLPCAAAPLFDYGQQAGELDEDAIPDYVRYGDRAIYIRQDEQPETGLDLTLLVDESGSMETAKQWRLASAAAISLEYALRPHFRSRLVRLRVYGFTSDIFAPGQTVLYRHFDSAVTRLNRPHALGWSFPKGNNADGIALEAMRQEMLHQHPTGRTLSLLMISDGGPNAEGYTGLEAQAHVRFQVDETIARGIRFAHLQVGDETEDHLLNAMYGKHWQRVVEAAAIPAAIVALIMRWLAL